MKFKHAVLALLGVMAAVSASSVVRAEDGLEDVKKRGVLKVGSKVDYRPFGFKDASGEAVGFEIDLAADVAKRLGVKLEIVPVISANRMEFLRQGRIDLMIATMTFRPERDEVVGIARPFYYASAQAALTAKSAGLNTWEELRGKPVCGVQGAAYNRSTEQEYGAKIVNLKSTDDIMNGLKEGKCVAAVYDSAYFAGKLLETEWADYEMKLPQINVEPWGLAVKKEDTKFRDFMSQTIEDWHKSGRLIELEAKWQIPATPFLREMHDKYKGS